MMNKSDARINWSRIPVYAIGEGNSTTLHFADGSSLLITYTLLVVHKRFPSLIRVHKTTAIDPAYVKRTRRDWVNRTLYLYLRDGVKVSVSRRRIAETSRVLSPHPRKRIKHV